MAMSNCSSAGLKPHNHSRDGLTASIIIVNCSGRRYLEGCLSSVLAELWPGCELKESKKINMTTRQYS
jgi:hypothetical protein